MNKLELILPVVNKVIETYKQSFDNNLSDIDEHDWSKINYRIIQSHN